MMPASRPAVSELWPICGEIDWTFCMTKFSGSDRT